MTEGNTSGHGTYQKILEQMDLESYLDYYCANLYFGNSQFDSFSTTLWRRAGEGETGKWHWEFSDATDTLGRNKAVSYTHLELLLENDIRFGEEFAICEDMAFSMQVLEKSKGICVVPESLYCYHYKEAENLVNRFHENYYEALLYFRDRTWQCFRTLQAKQELYAEVNACFVGKSLMYLHKIYRDSGYEETRKYAELKRIGGSLPLQNALREYRATGKRRLLRELLLHKRFRLLDSLYRWRCV